MRSLVEKLGFGRKSQEIKATYLYDVAHKGMYPYVATFEETLNRLRPDLAPIKMKDDEIPKIAEVLVQKFYSLSSASLLLPPELQQIISGRNSNLNGLDHITLFPQDIIVLIHEMRGGDPYIRYGLHASFRNASTKLFMISNLDASDFEDEGKVAGFVSGLDGTLDLAMLGKDLIDAREPVVWVANNHPYITFDFPNFPTQPSYKV